MGKNIFTNFLLWWAIFLFDNRSVTVNTLYTTSKHMPKVSKIMFRITICQLLFTLWAFKHDRLYLLKISIVCLTFSMRFWRKIFFSLVYFLISVFFLLVSLIFVYFWKLIFWQIVLFFIFFLAVILYRSRFRYSTLRLFWCLNFENRINLRNICILAAEKEKKKHSFGLPFLIKISKSVKVMGSPSKWHPSRRKDNVILIRNVQGESRSNLVTAIRFRKSSGKFSRLPWAECDEKAL